MAARIRDYHQDEIRAKIQASQLINRISDHVHKGIKMSQTQLRGAEILLRKVLPDLSSTELAIDPEANKLTVQVIRFTEKENDHGEIESGCAQQTSEG